ncbi:MAG: hypothetical protein RLZZ515_1205, partial [Cyanobacteriota bacterium]
MLLLAGVVEIARALSLSQGLATQIGHLRVGG